MRIGLLQHDDELAARIVRWLADDGHLVRRCRDARSATEMLAGGPCDLFVVDGEPPGPAGDDMRRSAHRAGVPLLYIVERPARDRAADALAGSTDGFVCTPLRRRDLAARVRDTARNRAPRADVPRESFEPFVFDLAARRVTRDGMPVNLTRREFDLALYLFRHTDQVLSRERLLEHIWGAQRRNLNTRTVDTHVSRLRRKLGLGTSRWRLGAVYQHGYRLESPPAPD